MLCSYNPKNSQTSNYLKEIGNNLDILSSKLANYLLMGDFNADPNQPAISDFCEIHNTKNIMKEKTCFKNPENPTCIDLILTNRPRSFQNSTFIEKGLPDLQKMCVTVMKMYYCKRKPSVITNRQFKHFSNIVFMQALEKHLTKCKQFDNISSNLFKETVNIIDLEKHSTKFEHFDNVPSSLFKETVNIILEKHLPTKKKYVRAN